MKYVKNYVLFGQNIQCMLGVSVFNLCRLHYFHIKYIDHEIELDDLEASVRKEMNDPGNLLGYRALHKMVREVNGQNVPRVMVYTMMDFVDHRSLKEKRRRCRPTKTSSKRKKKKRAFASKVRTKPNIYFLLRFCLTYFTKSSLSCSSSCQPLFFMQAVAILLKC